MWKRKNQYHVFSQCISCNRTQSRINVRVKLAKTVRNWTLLKVTSRPIQSKLFAELYAITILNASVTSRQHDKNKKIIQYQCARPRAKMTGKKPNAPEKRNREMDSACFYRSSCSAVGHLSLCDLGAVSPILYRCWVNNRRHRIIIACSLPRPPARYTPHPVPRRSQAYVDGVTTRHLGLVRTWLVAPSVGALSLISQPPAGGVRRLEFCSSSCSLPLSTATSLSAGHSPAPANPTR